MAGKSGSVGMCMNPIEMEAVRNLNMPGGNMNTADAYFSRSYIDAVISPDGLLANETLYWSADLEMAGTIQGMNINAECTTGYTEYFSYSCFGSTAVSKPSWA